MEDLATSCYCNSKVWIVVLVTKAKLAATVLFEDKDSPIPQSGYRENYSTRPSTIQSRIGLAYIRIFLLDTLSIRKNLKVVLFDAYNNYVFVWICKIDIQ